MHDPGHRPLGRIAILVVLVGAHGLLIELLSRSRHPSRSPISNQEAGILFFVTLPPENAAPVPPAVDSAAAVRPRIQPQADSAITLQEKAEPPARSIDWYAEAKDVARAQLDEANRPQARRFGQQPGSSFFKKKHKTYTPWQAEEKKAGFEGPLPYVRLGKRCVLIPPFIGCALGRIPKSKGITLEEVRDPDRPRDSVPDIEN